MLVYVTLVPSLKLDFKNMSFANYSQNCQEIVVWLSYNKKVSKKLRKFWMRTNILLKIYVCLVLVT